MTAIATTVAPAPTPEHGGSRPPCASPATNLRLMAREPMVAVGLIGFPLVTVLVLAGVFGQVPDPEFGGVAPDDHYLAGYIGVVLAALGLITLPVHIATAAGARRDPPVPGVGRERRRAWSASDILLGIVLGTVVGGRRAGRWVGRVRHARARRPARRGRAGTSPG